MVLHFDYDAVSVTTSPKPPTTTATREASYIAALALRFLYSSPTPYPNNFSANINALGYNALINKHISPRLRAFYIYNR